MKVNNITITFLVYFKDLINFLMGFQALRNYIFFSLLDMIVDKAISTLKFSLVCSCNLESAQMICTMWWWGYSSIRVSHAGRRSACWVRSDGTDWKTQLPPHIQPLLSYFTLTFWNRLKPSGNTPRNLVFGRSAEQNTKCGWQKVAEVMKGSSHVSIYR